MMSNRPREMNVRTIWERIESTFLNVMGFVDDNVLERKLFQSRLFDQAHFILGNTHFKILRNEPAGDNFCAFFFGASQCNDIEIGSPLLEFTVPVLESRLGYDNQVRARDIPVVFKIGRE